MEKLFKSIKFKIFVGIVALLLGVMLYCAATDGIASIPQKLLGFVTVPFQTVTTYVSNTVGGFFSKYTDIDEVIAENEEYKAQIDELTQQLIEYKNLKIENEQLKDILGIKEENTDFEFVNATVVGRDPATKYEKFKISKGSMQGVSVHDPVITSSGLVGWIEEVGLNYSVVRTILSPQLDVGISTFDTEILGVASGDLEIMSENRFIVEYMETRPKVGELVVTAGESGFFPKNLVLGTILETKMQRYGASYYAVVEPVDEISELHYVFVITDFIGQGEGIEEGE